MIKAKKTAEIGSIEANTPLQPDQRVSLAVAAEMFQ